jgi:hypothetical protein
MNRKDRIEKSNDLIINRLKRINRTKRYKGNRRRRNDRTNKID